MRLLSFFCSLFAVSAVFAHPGETAFPDEASVAKHVKARDGSPAARFVSPGVVELPATFSTFRKQRVRWTFDFHEDMRFAEGLEFDLFCTDCTCFSGFSLYFNTGKGCYTGGFNPLKEGEWHRIRVMKSRFGRTEGKVSGWKDVRAFTFAGWRAGTRDSLFRIRNIRVIRQKPEIVVVRGDVPEIKSPSSGYAAASGRMLKMLETMGMPVCEISEIELDEDSLKGVKLAVLPWNPSPPASAVDALRKFSAGGGKIMACYSTAGPVARFLGVKGSFLHVTKQPGMEACARMRRLGAGLPGQPELVDHPTACITKAQPSGKGDVLAVWEDRDGGGARLPALIRTPGGYFLAHTWKNMGVNGRALMKSILLDLEPSWRAAIESAEKAAAAEAAEAARRVAAYRPVAGEWRGIGCHSPGGPNGYTWDEAASLVKECGFTAIVPNVAETGRIHEKAAADCLAACRKYGLECWFWKVSWHPHHNIKVEFPGYCQVRYDGSPMKRWMCPSDPRNRAAEVEDFVKLARMRPDGISIDYARYPYGRDTCYCDGCRAAFERRFSLKTTDWPKDTRRNEDMKSKWTKFRCETITEFLREIARRVRTECPGVKIKTSCFHNEPEEAAYVVAQDWVGWCREGLIDIISPMNYYTGDSVFAYKGLLKSQMESLRGTSPAIYPGIGVSCWRATGYDALRTCEQIEAVREAGLKGFGVFELDARGIAVLRQLKR